MAEPAPGNPFDAWNRGDIDAYVAMFHPEATLTLIGGFEAMLGREFHGRDEIRRFCDEFRAAYAVVEVELEKLIPAGDRVVAIIRQRARAHEGESKAEMRTATVVSFRDGLFYRHENYYEVDEALRAVGLA